mmetsp:Transcript_31310/g.72848  ORF Transcript_31310/g.72848 Transcript_31310/m.72848 type:complete len:233 (-) Transcript_31310:863-1561(-)
MAHETELDAMPSRVEPRQHAHCARRQGEDAPLESAVQPRPRHAVVMKYGAQHAARRREGDTRIEDEAPGRGNSRIPREPSLGAMAARQHCHPTGGEEHSTRSEPEGIFPPVDERLAPLRTELRRVHESEQRNLRGVSLQVRAVLGDGLGYGSRKTRWASQPIRLPAICFAVGAVRDVAQPEPRERGRQPRRKRGSRCSFRRQRGSEGAVGAWDPSPQQLLEPPRRLVASSAH